MEAGYFLPSEVARLVLGYMKEEGYTTTCRNFLKECSHLSEYIALLKRGLEYPTSINGMSLSQILEEYAKLKILDIERRSMAPSVCSLWKQLDNIITNLKDQTSSKQQMVVQRSRTRRQVCNKRIGLPNENSDIQKQNPRTRRSLNLSIAPAPDSCPRRPGSELLGSSGDEQETNFPSSCTNRVMINKTGRRIIVKNSTPSSRLEQERSIVENASPIKTVPALFDDCENPSPRYNTRSAKKSQPNSPVKNSNLKHMCNNQTKLNRKLTSRTPKGESFYLNNNNLSLNSSHKYEASSETERDVEYESDSVPMETNFSTPQDRSPMLKICDETSLNKSTQDVTSKHISVGGTKQSTSTNGCESIGQSKSFLQIPDSQTSELHRDNGVPQTENYVNTNSANANQTDNKTVTTISLKVLDKTDIVGTVVCHTTALNSSDSGFAPSISSEPRCSEEVDLQNSSSEKTPTEMDMEKNECPTARTLFSCSETESSSQIEVRKPSSPASVQASIVSSGSDQSLIVPATASGQGHLVTTVHSPTPMSNCVKMDKDCSENSLGFTPVKQKSVAPSEEKTQSSREQIISLVPTEQAQPPFQFCPKMASKSENDLDSEHPVLSLQTNEESQPPFDFCMKTPSKMKEIENQSVLSLPKPDDSQHSFEFCLKTPVKSTARVASERIIGKSPRRKRPPRKRLSVPTCVEPTESVHGDSGESAHATEGASPDESMPEMSFKRQILEQLLGDKTLHEKLAQSINRGLHVDSQQACRQSPDSVKQIEMKTEEAQQAKNVTSPPIHREEKHQTLEQILDIQETQMSGDQISAIIDMTQTDPAFDALFNLFNADKNEFIEREYLSTHVSGRDIHSLATSSRDIGQTSNIQFDNAGGLLASHSQDLDSEVTTVSLTHPVMVETDRICTQTQVAMNVDNHTSRNQDPPNTLIRHLDQSPCLSTIKSNDLFSLGISHMTCEDEIGGNTICDNVQPKTQNPKSTPLSKSRGLVRSDASILSSRPVTIQPKMTVDTMDNLQALQSLLNLQNIAQNLHPTNKPGASDTIRSRQSPPKNPASSSCSTHLSQILTQPVMTSSLQQPIKSSHSQSVTKGRSVKEKLVRKKRVSRKATSKRKSLPAKTAAWSPGLTALVKLTSPLKSSTLQKDQAVASGSQGEGFTICPTESSEEQEYLSVLSPGGTSYIKIPFIQNASMITVQSPVTQSVGTVDSLGQASIGDRSMINTIPSDSPTTIPISSGSLAVNPMKKDLTQHAVNPHQNVYIATPLGMAVSKQIHVRSLNFGHEAQTVGIRQPGFGRGRKQSKITDSFNKGKKEIKTSKGRGVGRKIRTAEEPVGISYVQINPVLSQQNAIHQVGMVVEETSFCQASESAKTEIHITEKAAQADTLLPNAEMIVSDSERSTVLTLDSGSKTNADIHPVNVIQVHEVMPVIGTNDPELPSNPCSLDIVNISENKDEHTVYATASNKIELYLQRQSCDKAQEDTGLVFQNVQMKNIPLSPPIEVKTSEAVNQEVQPCLQTAHIHEDEIFKCDEIFEEKDLVQNGKAEEDMGVVVQNVQMENISPSPPSLEVKTSETTNQEVRPSLQPIQTAFIPKDEILKLNPRSEEKQEFIIYAENFDVKSKSPKFEEKKCIQNEIVDKKTKFQTSDEKQKLIQNEIVDENSKTPKSKEKTFIEVPPVCVAALSDTSSTTHNNIGDLSLEKLGTAGIGINRTERDKHMEHTTNCNGSVIESRNDIADELKCKKVRKNANITSKVKSNSSNPVYKIPKRRKGKMKHQNVWENKLKKGKLRTAPKLKHKSPVSFPEKKKGIEVLDPSGKDTEIDDDQSLASLVGCIKTKKYASLTSENVSTTDMSPLRKQSIETSKMPKNKLTSTSAKSDVSEGIENRANIEKFGIFHPNVSYREISKAVDTDTPLVSESSLSSDYLISKSCENPDKGEVVLCSDNIVELYSIFQTCKINQKPPAECLSASNSEEEVDVESEVALDPRQQLLDQQAKCPPNETQQSVHHGTIKNTPRKSITQECFSKEHFSPKISRRELLPTNMRTKSSDVEYKSVLKNSPKRVSLSGPASKETTPKKGKGVQTTPGKIRDNSSPCTPRNGNRAKPSNMDKALTPSKARQKSPKVKQTHLSPKSNKYLDLPIQKNSPGCKTDLRYSKSPQQVRHIEIAEVMPTPWSSTVGIVSSESDMCNVAETDHATNKTLSSMSFAPSDPLKMPSPTDSVGCKLPSPTDSVGCKLPSPTDSVGCKLPSPTDSVGCTGDFTSAAVRVARSDTHTEGRPDSCGAFKSPGKDHTNARKRKREASGGKKTKRTKTSKDSGNKKPLDLASLDVEKFLSKIHN
ncbi:hypothetical protein ScPMuIL_013417 [Solemya velum]